MGDGKKQEELISSRSQPYTDATSSFTWSLSITKSHVQPPSLNRVLLKDEPFSCLEHIPCILLFFLYVFFTLISPRTQFWNLVIRTRQQPQKHPRYTTTDWEKQPPGYLLRNTKDPQETKRLHLGQLPVLLHLWGEQRLVTLILLQHPTW